MPNSSGQPAHVIDSLDMKSSRWVIIAALTSIGTRNGNVSEIFTQRAGCTSIRQAVGTNSGKGIGLEPKDSLAYFDCYISGVHDSISTWHPIPTPTPTPISIPTSTCPFEPSCARFHSHYRVCAACPIRRRA